ncbi:precorrin-6y C5,15-methyltransferase (decarboxylating) subunit CbiE [Planomonospora sp. ID67723]|uniref:precorrin-6y C5,15-methyltransferase (decarboxylating) subunit CbiE n=1 Tax=Planomonospora sp. ID67723 TaxID=2738134 RepID=UPI0018C3B789|nr:precorrin-6y C5,15-methyltransferase (decarboxylating) subunit CbiE [Planomonospora sp. ID67723]MBG0832760.1 precorrin-6y C5,15-methyltransferase (decarboxylating) subunit CbiE [Planomonospora sp. ID67723]
MITVVGVDGAGLSAEAQARLDEAVLVAGSDRVFRRLGGVPAGVRRAEGPLLEVVDAHLETGEGTLVVLAEGDPGFFDVVRELRGHGVTPEVLPARPLASLAFARAGLAWEDALIVTGGRLDRVVNACRAHHKVAVLVTPGVGPAEIARELAPTTPRALIVCEDLGGPDERITHSRMGEATTRPWKDPDVVLVLDPLHRPHEPGWVAGARPGPGEWALDFDGARLSPQVRAFALAKLGPRLGELVWDVGAGTGEIAVECARMGAAVVAVEREEESCARLRRNVIAHGVKVALTRGQAPPALEPLADPDAVFVGGGGADVVAACAARAPRSLVCALRTVEQVVTVLDVLREHGYHAECVQLQSSRLTVQADGAHRLAASDPIFVVYSAGG